MAEFAYEHDISRPPARTVDPEEDRISQVIELMNQLHVYVLLKSQLLDFGAITAQYRSLLTTLDI
jgi:hypothetical protein